VVSPHFSYDDNFIPQSSFGDDAWQTFANAHPEALTELDEMERIQGPNRDGFMAVDIRDLGDWGRRHPQAISQLIVHSYEASQLIADALMQETALGNLSWDSERSRLARSAGSCRFCVNSRWRFPEGCIYGLDVRAGTPAEALEETFQDVRRQLDLAQD